jgi:hypothetical protein
MKRWHKWIAEQEYKKIFLRFYSKTHAGCIIAESAVAEETDDEVGLSK